MKQKMRQEIFINKVAFNKLNGEELKNTYRYIALLKSLKRF